ncbi:hypothetical protein [Natrinema versiforme]|nr:hypothetical protein [Natrinema versiforme]
MDQRRRDLLVAGGGMLVLGTYAVITGRAGEIEPNAGVLLVAAGLGTGGAVIEHAWDRTIPTIVVGAVIGGFIGALGTDETWVELLVALFAGGFLGTVGWDVLESWLSDSYPESAPAR